MGGSIILVPLRFIYNLGNISIPTPLARLGFVTLPIAIALLAALNYSKDWLQAKSNPFFWDPHHIEEYDFIVGNGKIKNELKFQFFKFHSKFFIY